MSEKNLVPISFCAVTILIFGFINTWAAALCFVAACTLFGLHLVLERRDRSETDVLSDRIKTLEDKVSSLQLRNLR